MTLAFIVRGRAAPGGSKRAFTNPHTGRTVVTDDAAGGKPWRELVQSAALDAIDGQPTPVFGPDEPLMLQVVFYRARPRSHYGSGRNAERLKPSAPAFPTMRPDLLKTARALEDALTGIAWPDDARIVTEALCKRWARPGELERVEVLVQRQPGAVASGATAPAPEHAGTGGPPLPQPRDEEQRHDDHGEGDQNVTHSDPLPSRPVADSTGPEGL